MPKESYASKFARLGGQTKSAARAAASRRNGKLGGRPKGSTAGLQKQMATGAPKIRRGVGAALENKKQSAQGGNASVVAEKESNQGQRVAEKKTHF